MSRFSALTRDPLRVNAFLIVFAFGSVFILPSQTTSSFVTYVLGVAMLAGFRRWRGLLEDPLLQLAFGLQAYLALSALWSNPLVVGKAFSNGGRVLVTILFLVAFAECWRTGILQRWLGRVVTVCAALSALTAIVYFLVTSPEDGRLNGLGQLGAHVIAGLLWGVALILLLDSLRGGFGARWRAVAVGCATVIVTAIVLTASRNAWMSVLAGLLVYGCARRFESRRTFVTWVASLGSLVVVLVVASLFTETGHELLMPRGDSFRLLIWSTILDRVWEGGIVFGVGILTPDDVQNGPWVHPHPHSMYLSVLYQGGLVALGGFLLLIFLVMRRLFTGYGAPQVAPALGILAIGLLSYLLDGHEFVDRIGETWLLFWLPVAFALSLRSRQPTR